MANNKYNLSVTEGVETYKLSVTEGVETYKLSVVDGTELQLSLNGGQGPMGPANTLFIGDVTTAETNVPAAALITGAAPTQTLHLTLPKGNTGAAGAAATVTVGPTTTGAAGSSASVSNSGSSSAAVLNFTIPQGATGTAGDKYQTTSSTNLLIPAIGDSITITIGTGLSYSVNQTILVSHDINNHIHAEVDSYNSSTGVLVAVVTDKEGSGMYSSWVVNLSGAVGAIGPQGPQGPQGPDGADALWNYTGEYNVGASYAVGDVATYGGETFYRTDAHDGNTGDTPSDISPYWDLLAAKGVDGSNDLPLAGGTMDADAIISIPTSGTNSVTLSGNALTFDNGSSVSKGTTDAGLGGSKGVALKCSIAYELKWEAGRLYTMDQYGFTIRRVDHCGTTVPTATDDSTKGFVAGSIWALDDGTTYVCSSNTTDAAIWSEIVGYGEDGQIRVPESVSFGNTGRYGNLKFPSDYFIQLGADINGEAADDASGYSVSMNAAGDRVAIGAPYNDDNGNLSGRVCVYSWNGTAWTQLGLGIDGEAVADLSGYSVSMNAAGDRVAIGAYLNDDNGNNSGYVRVYSWDNTAWTQLGLDINGKAAGDLSGYSVSMNAAGDRVAIGATQNDDNGNNSGHVRVYSWDDTAWTQLGLDINGKAADDRSGYSVSMNAAGNRVAIGAIQNDDNGNNSGHVRVYSWDNTAWTQLGLDINGKAADDASGYSVSMNAAGDRVAIGAIQNDDDGNNSGHVRVYSWDNTAWTQLGLDINGEAADDQSGYSVSMNAAGDRVAIGAPYNDDNGNSSGHVRVYSWNGTAWTQLVVDINGEAADDQSGYSVSMNAAGDRVAIGAIQNDGNGNNSGHVRVYGRLSSQRQWTLPDAGGTVVVSNNPVISTATVAETPNTIVSRDGGGRINATRLRLHGATYYSQLNFSPNPTGNTSFDFPNTSGVIATTNAVVMLTGEQTAYGSKTFAGQMELTGQALTNGTSAVTRSLADARYSFAPYIGINENNVSSTNNTPITLASVTLPIGRYRIDSLISATSVSSAGGFYFSLNSSLPIKVTLVESYGADGAATSSASIGNDSITTMSRGIATGTSARRLLTGVVDIITANTVVSIEFSQNTTNAVASTTRKRAYIFATKIA